MCVGVGVFGGGCIFFSIYFPAHVSLTVRFLYVLKSVAILVCESGHLCYNLFCHNVYVYQYEYASTYSTYINSCVIIHTLWDDTEMQLHI